jgi:hypothetical protein
MMRLEYRSISAPINRIEIESLGLQGWVLCAVDGAVAWLCRDKDARHLEEQAARHAEERGEK